MVAGDSRESSNPSLGLYWTISIYYIKPTSNNNHSYSWYSGSVKVWYAK